MVGRGIPQVRRGTPIASRGRPQPGNGTPHPGSATPRIPLLIPTLPKKVPVTIPIRRFTRLGDATFSIVNSSQGAPSTQSLQVQK